MIQASEPVCRIVNRLSQAYENLARQDVSAIAERAQEGDVVGRSAHERRMRKFRCIGFHAFQQSGEIDPICANQELNGCIERIQKACESLDESALLLF